MKLTIEQQFEVKAFAMRCKTLTARQQQSLLVEIFQKMIEQREVCKQILGHSLGLADIPEFDGLPRHE